jgi:adenylylsulfate kinase
MDQRAGALTIWLTGLPSAGKTTIATALADRLSGRGHRVELLDGDIIRTNLGKGLGFSKDDRDENVRRVGWVANLLSRNGVFVVCALVSPYRAARDEVRRVHNGRFFEVHVAAPSAVCRSRDVKGLYAGHASGKLTGLTGVDDPYEPPLNPDLILPTHEQSPAESAEMLWEAIERMPR